MAKVKIDKSQIAGRGLFATRTIAKDELILEMRGPIIKYPFPPEPWIGPNWVSVARNTWMMARRGMAWRYLNHSCEPNAGFRGRLKLVAMRPISQGEEVTADYSFIEADDRWRMRCACGARRCRKIIQGIGYLPYQKFEHCQQYIPAYLQRQYLSQKTYAKTGLGIYAKFDIRKDESIFKVEGPIVKYTEYPEDRRIGYKWLGVAPFTWLIPLRRNPWWSMRHACEPNTGLRNKTTVVAMRNISRNEELTIDNAITEADPLWRMRCSCEAPNCRGIVRSVQFLPRELFETYQPYTPYFLQQAYAEANNLTQL